MDSLPADFRVKYDQMRTVIDPLTQKSVTDVMGGSFWGFKEYENGARRFNFSEGDIASFDHTNRYPIVCIYGPLFKRYVELGGHERSALGRPLTDVRDLPDGSRCAVFEGGHLHQWADNVDCFPASQCMATWQPPPPPFAFGMGPHNMPLVFLYKWQELALIRDPLTGHTVGQKLGPIDYDVSNIDVGGQRIVFSGGEIVVHDNRGFGVYGPIFKYWTGVNGGWGRPMTDEQELQDGGRCQVFEGGHIHRYGDTAGPVPPERCTARFRPLPRPGLAFNRMNPFYQYKWSQLLLVNKPDNQKPIALELGDLDCFHERWNGNKPGHYFTFSNGLLGSHTHDMRPAPPGTPLELMAPFAVYGGIFSFWWDAGGSDSKYGRPICDQQGLPDGGRCNIFEGGHIHFYNGESREFPAHDCKAPYQPRPPRDTLPTMPNQPFLQGQSPEAYYPPSSAPEGFGSSPHHLPTGGVFGSSPVHLPTGGGFGSSPLHHLPTSVPGGFGAHLPHMNLPSFSDSRPPQPDENSYNGYQPPPQPDMIFQPAQPPEPAEINYPQPPFQQPVADGQGFSMPFSNANNETSGGKPLGLIAALIFGIIGYNIEKDCKGDDDDGGCCCCCCC